jgi:hypothetical protein
MESSRLFSINGAANLFVCRKSELRCKGQLTLLHLSEARMKGRQMGMVWQSVLVACLVAGFCRPAAAEEEIKFAPKMFADGSEAVEVSGTLTGTGVGYPNNTHVVSCVKDRKECFVTAVEAHEHYVTRVTGPNIIPITSWTDAEIVAQEELSSSQCSRTTITLSRKRSIVLWVQEPTNQTKTWCAKSETRILKWTIEDPAYYSGMRGK